MNFFKNKHIIASMIIAPILAVLSWFAVDHFVKETPHQLQNNASYKLLVKSNCRWESGLCDLENNDVKFNFSTTKNNYNKTLTLTSSINLDSVNIAVTDNINTNSIPEQMVKQNDKTWVINTQNIDNSFLQVVATTGGTIFYAIIPTIWTNKEDLIYDKYK